jgi:hypothetical protein
MPRNADVMAVCDALEQSLRDVTEPAPSHMTAPTHRRGCAVRAAKNYTASDPWMRVIEELGSAPILDRLLRSL